MEKETDLRVRRTNKCLEDAFWELLEKKTFEKITVNEICDRAMVGRCTFYKHFTDKYEFICTVMKGMLDQYLEDAERSCDAEDPSSYCMAFLGAFMHFMEDKKKIFKKLESNALTGVVLFSTYDAAADRLQKHFLQDTNEGNTLCLDPYFAAHFLAGAMVQNAWYWTTRPDYPGTEVLTSNMKILLEKIYN